MYRSKNNPLLQAAAAGGANIFSISEIELLCLIYLCLVRPTKHFRNHQQRPRKNLLIGGERQIIRAMDEGIEIEKIFIGQQKHFPELLTRARDKGVPFSKVPVERLNSFHLEGHEGCIALKSKVHYFDLQDMISWVVERGESPFFLLLDGITDIRNIGGIARTAYCCGIHGLVIPQKGVGSLNEDAFATSAGALEHMAVSRVGDLETAIELLKLNGIKVLATEMKAEAAIFGVNFNEPVAIIMGSEDKGIQPGILKKCDAVFSIPMKNNFESLNVSAATAMILYEAMKQRIQIPVNG